MTPPTRTGTVAEIIVPSVVPPTKVVWIRLGVDAVDFVRRTGLVLDGRPVGLGALVEYVADHPCFVTLYPAAEPFGLYERAEVTTMGANKETTCEG